MQLTDATMMTSSRDKSARVAAWRMRSMASLMMASFSFLQVSLSHLVSGPRLTGALSLEMLEEVFGLGPLEPLMRDPTISDILVNGPKNCYVERRGKLEKTDLQFRDNEHLLQIIDRIVSKVGRRVDETSPLCDARLPGHS